MRRKLFKAVSALSLLLCVATVVLWVRSHWVCDEIFLRYRVDGSERLALRRGNLLIQHFRPDDGIRGKPIAVSHTATAIPWIPPTGWPKLHRIEIPLLDIWFVNVPPPDRKRVEQARQELRPEHALHPPAEIGAQDLYVLMTDQRITSAHRFLRDNFPSYWAVRVPIWPATVLFMVPPAMLGLKAAMRMRRRFREQCPTCGYSLTGNTSGTCPECGTPIPHASRPA